MRARRQRKKMLAMKTECTSDFPGRDDDLMRMLSSMRTRKALSYPLFKLNQPQIRK